MALSLDSATTLGLHLTAGASDGYVMTSDDVYSGATHGSVTGWLEYLDGLVVDDHTTAIAALENGLEDLETLVAGLTGDDIDYDTVLTVSGKIDDIVSDLEDLQTTVDNLGDISDSGTVTYTAGDGIDISNYTVSIDDSQFGADMYFSSGRSIGVVTLLGETYDVWVPNASSTDKGIVQIGDGLSISDGVLSVSGSSSSDSSLSDAEISWVQEQVFNELFEVEIIDDSGTTYTVFDYDEENDITDYTVTFVLLVTYDGTAVDLDSVPSGWTRAGTGTYTKEVEVTYTTGSSVSSGSVSCTYNGYTKTASAVSHTNVKYSYYLNSSSETLTSLDGMDEDGTRLNSSTSSNTISGTKTITTEDGCYVYFCIANTSSLSSVTQLGLNFLQTDDDGNTESYTLTFKKEGMSIGVYTIYRSSVAMSAGTQSVTIA